MKEILTAKALMDYRENALLLAIRVGILLVIVHVILRAVFNWPRCYYVTVNNCLWKTGFLRIVVYSCAV